MTDPDLEQIALAVQHQHAIHWKTVVCMIRDAILAAQKLDTRVRTHHMVVTKLQEALLWMRAGSILDVNAEGDPS